MRLLPRASAPGQDFLAGSMKAWPGLCNITGHLQSFGQRRGSSAKGPCRRRAWIGSPADPGGTNFRVVQRDTLSRASGGIRSRAYPAGIVLPAIPGRPAIPADPWGPAFEAPSLPCRPGLTWGGVAATGLRRRPLQPAEAIEKTSEPAPVTTEW